MKVFTAGLKWFTLIALTAALVSCSRYLERSLDTPLVSGDSVTFSVKSPAARTVQLAGDWFGSNWGEGDAESGEVLVGLMEQGRGEKQGIWQITIQLQPGRYRYRFLLNETEWLLDPENPRVVDDGRGGKANLLIVP